MSEREREFSIAEKEQPYPGTASHPGGKMFQEHKLILASSSLTGSLQIIRI